MMRWSAVILCLMTIGVALIHIRRAESQLQYERQKIQARHGAVRRDLWQRQSDLHELTTPAAIEQRAQWLGLNVTRSASIRKQQARIDVRREGGTQ
jgi:hypothetical protein